MAEIVEGILEALGTFFSTVCPPWILADVILGGASLLFVAVIGNLADFLTEVFMDVIIGAIPFQLNLLAIYYLTPLYLVFQFILFIILLAVFASRK